jgi:peptidoglycan L-alanyl-D-glutamate endopeptidase CwlK
MSKLDSLDPAFRDIMTQVIEQVSIATGLAWIPVSTRRTIAEQNKLYAQGRTQPGKIVTKAKGGQSPHNFGLACDCAPLAKGNDHTLWWDAPRGYWDAYGAIAESFGLVWGGKFKSLLDLPHCETPDWKDTQAQWLAGKLNVS